MTIIGSGSFMVVKLRKKRIPFWDRYQNNKLLLKLYQHDLDKNGELSQQFEQCNNKELTNRYKNDYYHAANNVAHMQSLIADDERWFVSISLATIALILQSIFGIIL